MGENLLHKARVAGSSSTSSHPVLLTDEQTSSERVGDLIRMWKKEPSKAHGDNVSSTEKNQKEPEECLLQENNPFCLKVGESPMIYNAESLPRPGFC